MYIREKYNVTPIFDIFTAMIVVAAVCHCPGSSSRKSERGALARDKVNIQLLYMVESTTTTVYIHTHI